MDQDYIFECPHCHGYVIVNRKEFNCKIFRHGTKKGEDNKGIGEQVYPHASKEECDSLYQKNEIYGCGKPFRIIKTSQEQYTVEECGYI